MVKNLGYSSWHYDGIGRSENWRHTCDSIYVRASNSGLLHITECPINIFPILNTSSRDFLQLFPHHYSNWKIPVVLDIARLSLGPQVFFLVECSSWRWNPPRIYSFRFSTDLWDFTLVILTLRRARCPINNSKTSLKLPRVGISVWQWWWWSWTCFFLHHDTNFCMAGAPIFLLDLYLSPLQQGLFLARNLTSNYLLFNISREPKKLNRYNIVVRGNFHSSNQPSL